MVRIKNLRAGRLFVTDAGLKLLPGQVISVENISLQTQSLIDKGYVARLDTTPKQPETVPKKEVSLPVIPKEYEELHAAEAIEYVDKIADTLLLRTILKEEKRKTVIEAIEQRLKTLKLTS